MVQLLPLLIVFILCLFAYSDVHVHQCWNDGDQDERGVFGAHKEEGNNFLDSINYYPSPSPRCQHVKVVMVLQDCAKGPYGQAARMRRHLEIVFGPSYMCYSLAYGYLAVEDLEDYDVIIIDGSGEDFVTVADWLSRGDSQEGASFLEAFVERGQTLWFNAAVEARDEPLVWPLAYGAILRQSGNESYSPVEGGIRNGSYPTVTCTTNGTLAHGSIASLQGRYAPLMVDPDSGNPLLVGGFGSDTLSRVLLGTLTPFVDGRLNILESLCDMRGT